MSIPASRPLRWLAAGLVLAAAVLALALPFISATLLTIAIGGVAIASGLLGGPIGGLAAFIALKLTKDPFDNLVSFRYVRRH